MRVMRELKRDDVSWDRLAKRGMITATPEMVEAAARAAHEANRAYCKHVLKDLSILSWDATSEENRQSSRIGVRGVLGGNDPEQSHALWMATRLAAGWVYGELKDEVARTHPCLVPYAELPQAQRAKDRLFIDCVRAMWWAAAEVEVAAHQGSRDEA